MWTYNHANIILCVYVRFTFKWNVVWCWCMDCILIMRGNKFTGYRHDVVSSVCVCVCVCVKLLLFWAWKAKLLQLQRLKKEAKNLSLIPVNDSKTNHLEERGNDTIWATKKQSDSDCDIKCANFQFYDNNHNSWFDCWIGLKLYVQSHDMFSYLRLKFQVNQNSRKHRNTGQQRLYEFCYLLPFDLWTSSLATIVFLQGCGN
jgi:hypothetical protein